MHNIFESDFNDFLFALQVAGVEYIVVGGYAVIMHGYFRTTQDLDVWVNKTAENYLRVRKAFAVFGMPMFDITEENFLGEKFDVFSIGRSPLRIDLITKLKGVSFNEAFANAVFKQIESIHVRYLSLNDLFDAKKASGRHKDLDDIEKLSK
jgi:hypothetical protein